MTSKKYLLNLAITSISLAAADNSAQAVPKIEGATESVSCFGIQAKAGDSRCAVTQSQIDKANKVFHNKYAKSEAYACAGFNKCGAKKGTAGKDATLAWLEKPTKEECFKEGGFIFDEKGEIVSRKEKEK